MICSGRPNRSRHCCTFSKNAPECLRSAANWASNNGSPFSRQAMLLAEDHPEDPHAFFGTDRRAIETGMADTVEVDHQRDLYWAEAVLRAQTASSSGARCPRPGTRSEDASH